METTKKWWKSKIGVWLLAIMLLPVMTGCAQVKFNPETKDFTYTRIGDQTIEGLDVVLADGTGIELNKQQSQVGELVELIKLLAPVIAVP